MPPPEEMSQNKEPNQANKDPEAARPLLGNLASDKDPPFQAQTAIKQSPLTPTNNTSNTSDQPQIVEIRMANKIVDDNEVKMDVKTFAPDKREDSDSKNYREFDVDIYK
jgi:hypothetical protein